ncbi:UPF0114 domain-containing protein [Quillaja saponaria]|uniref:UPF0114 domain-containing protein n=1 Tax=Quillaja saponaria TaxID=32244 RepID=A0AAD7PTV9_QUISA|nr:UPF0114 domain-containing protein [Quillaja saponaria]
MSTNRLLRTSSPLRFVSSSSGSPLTNTVRCVNKAGLNNEDTKMVNSSCIGKSERKPMVAVKASVEAASDRLITSQPRLGRGILLDFASLVQDVRHFLLVLVRMAVKQKSWNLHPQMLIENVIIDCRFFTFFAVAGSLLGSVLCFMEGCTLVIASYLQYFQTLSQSTDQGHVMHLLIEAIDMFLVGMAMLIFGVGLYVMFVGSKTIKEKGAWLNRSNLFGLFYMKSPPTWIGIESIGQAKSKIGHAVMMILQVGLLEKFNNIPLVTGFDLACFAGAVLTSSASIFLLSKLNQ